MPCKSGSPKDSAASAFPFQKTPQMSGSYYNDEPREETEKRMHADYDIYQLRGLCRVANIRGSGYMNKSTLVDAMMARRDLLVAVDIRTIRDTLKSKEGVIAAVSRNGLVLRYAPNALRRDMDIVKVAIENDDRARYYVDADVLHAFDQYGPRRIPVVPK
jgi:hypothetical protein